MRRIAVIVFSLVLGSLARAERPNIVFILSDDHAAAAISAYGSVVNRTPNIDAIAEQGVILNNCFCGNSICGPSRATIITGLHSHAHGFMTNGNEFDTSLDTFPKLLHAAGYATGLFGKWHLKSEPQGFDAWEVYPDQGEYYNPEYVTPEGRVQREGYCVELTTDRALEWVANERDKDKPFLLMLQFKAPHRNWMPGPDYLDMYDDVEIPEPATLFASLDGFNRGVREQEMEIKTHMTWGHDLKVGEGSDEPGPDKWWKGQLARMTPEQRARWDAAYGPKNKVLETAKFSEEGLIRWKYQRYIKDYLRCVAAVDDAVGRVDEFLKANGLADNTIVIYVADQGFFLGENGWFDKRWMYEESLRMPFVIKWPGVIEPGQRLDQIIQNVDFAPMLLDAVGLDVPEPMHGESFLPLMRGEDIEWRDAAYYHYFQSWGWHNVPRHHGVRTDRYKLIRYEELDAWEFFDLETDPDEQRNAYADADYQDIISELGEVLEAKKVEFGDND